MEVFVELDTKRIRVPLRWTSRDKNPVPPAGWYNLLAAEVREYRARQSPQSAFRNFLAGRRK